MTNHLLPFTPSDLEWYDRMLRKEWEATNDIGTQTEIEDRAYRHGRIDLLDEMIKDNKFNKK